MISLLRCSTSPWTPNSLYMASVSRLMLLWLKLNFWRKRENKIKLNLEKKTILEI